MKRQSILLSIITVFICVLPALTCAGTKLENILLITMDTARADHFGFAGYAYIKTPNIDKLAEESINFVYAYSPSPLTLPSHASILTGLYPQTHGVHENDLFQLRKSVETLTDFLHSKKYHTAAFVSSIILGSQYGLNKGFDYYDDLHIYSTIDNRIVERKASATTDSVCKYVTTLQAPFFIWVHYFDPHFPYQPPEPFATEYASHLYDGEIAYMDGSIGILLKCIQTKFNKKDIITIITADHGEGLNQHEEDRHGILLYNSTIKVPLLLKIPGVKPGRIIDNVSLVDIAPTILDYLNIPLPNYLEGRSLMPYLIAQKSKQENNKRAIFLETFSPYFTYRWAPLFGIIMDDYKFIKANTPELYSMKQDPGEENNLFSTNKDLVITYSSKLYSFFSKSLTYPWDIKQFYNSTDADATIKEKLKSLGYVASPPIPAKQPANLPDPKSMIYLLKKLDSAQILLYQGIYHEAFAILEEILQKDKENGPALTLAAECLMKGKKYNEAIPFLKKAAELYPQNDSILVTMSIANKNTGKPAEAENLLHQALKMNPLNPATNANLLILYASTNNLAKAEQIMQDINTKKLDHPDISFAQGAYYIKLQKFEDAKIAFEKGLVQSPDNTSAIANLAKIYYLVGNIKKAIELYEKFLSINPDDAIINAFVGSLYLNNLKNKSKALQYLKKALDLDPQNADADKWRALISLIEKA